MTRGKVFECEITVSSGVEEKLLRKEKTMRHPDKLSEVFRMSDEELEKFWEQNEPEDFEGWQEGTLKFTHPPKKSV